MKIITRSEANHVEKPEGTTVDYYLFRDYEIHYNEQAPHTIQIWHHHEQIWETLYIIEGELVAYWEQNGEENSQIVRAGDLIETERTQHTFSNESDEIVKFLVLKRMPSDEDYSDVFKSDKIVR